MEIVVRQVIGYRWHPEGGCSVFVEAELGGTVRDRHELRLATAAEVAALRAILAAPPA